MGGSAVLDRLIIGLEADHWLVQHNASRALAKYSNHVDSYHRERTDGVLKPGCFLGWGFTCSAGPDDEDEDDVLCRDWLQEIGHFASGKTSSVPHFVFTKHRSHSGNRCDYGTQLHLLIVVESAGRVPYRLL